MAEFDAGLDNQANNTFENIIDPALCERFAMDGVGLLDSLGRRDL